MKRCAIYTRKSTDEGLDQSFNSLDAQREACEAFVVSQRHEGWLLVRKTYDDGGFSGGSMERPALQQLLADITSGLVDTVVVYKIDRLTRCLADFAKMVEVFDARGVTFVSVTQQFNTTTSMGRLTLNVLLSFAQFEREVTAERIRDKIAASKKKGMWMGGPPPLGYDVQNKKLVINPKEADQVRKLFQAYLDLGSTKALTRWASDNGITTKVRYHTDGRIRSGGKPFSRGNLHALLSYRAYVGEVEHKGAVYPGNHDAILSRDLWDRVQAELSSQSQRNRPKAGTPPTLPLTGLVFDETGDRLTPIHATKTGRRYYYYVSSRLNQIDTPDASAWRLPAAVLEQAVVTGMISCLKDHSQIEYLLQEHIPYQIKQVRLLDQILTGCEQLAERLSHSDPRDAAYLIAPSIQRIELATGQMIVRINLRAWLAILGYVDGAQFSPPSADATHSLLLTLEIKRRGVETRLVISDGKEAKASYDQGLVRAIVTARAWFEDLKSGAAVSVNDIAARDNVPASEVSRQLPLAFLAPPIVSAILAGLQPVALTAKTITRLVHLPLDWKEQARLLGFRSV